MKGMVIHMDVRKILKHRYPFLMVDKIIEHKYNEKIVGIKYISSNEHWVQGHFPEEPIFPGVYILECMAQIGGLIFYTGDEDKTSNEQNKFAWLAGADKVKFLKPVVPGDVLRIEASFIMDIGSTGKVSCVAWVDETKVASAEVLYVFK